MRIASQNRMITVLKSFPVWLYDRNRNIRWELSWQIPKTHAFFKMG